MFYLLKSYISLVLNYKNKTIYQLMHFKPVVVKYKKKSYILLIKAIKSYLIAKWEKKSQTL